MILELATFKKADMLLFMMPKLAQLVAAKAANMGVLPLAVQGARVGQAVEHGRVVVHAHGAQAGSLYVAVQEANVGR
jgi:hypothetical protein